MTSGITLTVLLIALCRAATLDDPCAGLCDASSYCCASPLGAQCCPEPCCYTMFDGMMSYGWGANLGFPSSACCASSGGHCCIYTRDGDPSMAVCAPLGRTCESLFPPDDSDDDEKNHLENTEAKPDYVSGIDTNQYVSKKLASCLKMHFNIEVFVLEGWLPNSNRININGLNSYKELHGSFDVRLYFYPCVNGTQCTPAQEQVKEFSQAFKPIGQDVMVFVDVEPANNRTPWFIDIQRNANFLETTVTTLQQEGWKVGIYTSEPNWTKFFPAKYERFSNLPLWWIKVLNVRRECPIDQWKPFGGWKRPVAIQWNQDVSTAVCGAPKYFKTDRNCFFAV